MPVVPASSTTVGKRGGGGSPAAAAAGSGGKELSARYDLSFCSVWLWLCLSVTVPQCSCFVELKNRYIIGVLTGGDQDFADA